MQYHCDRCSRPTDRPIALEFQELLPSRGRPDGKKWLAGVTLCPSCAADFASQARVSGSALDRVWGK